MNWGRAKTILIVFFLLLNIGLGTILVYMNYSEASLSDEVIDVTIDLLKQNEIGFVDHNIVPKQKFSNQNYTLSTLQFSEGNLLELWLGENYTKIKSDPIAHSYIYENQEKKLNIEKTHIEFVCNKVLKLQSPTAKTEDIQKFLREKLRAFAFEEKDYYFDKVYFENGLYHATISPYAESAKVIGVELHVAADAQAIVQLTGNWFTASGKEILSDSGMMDITAVMANLIYLETDAPITLSEISCAAYVPGDYLNNKTITAVPIYVFICTDGRRFCYDARSGMRIV